ncbi:uncharacterized protein CTHT_0010290 [Thermochaetoides thermophila DSM 1495]|uniref:Autophagy-related protein 11 n=1 Tax=Chaetomium thermophilum (strain DSM 1495 / CBS 144.50 / IMI 039719) TaxID=759272 RepID=G0S0K0_CHATD|nr:hypothetical protein CTHT_0010290 [Thermochaetoides thermophila DSM 1495]EGS23361.1 hypothetical protein CTHT_0010290 [Thermochaetoides thermophila DSM 1495]
MIILTSQGKPWKPQNLPLEKELYVYDNRLAQSHANGAPPDSKSEVTLPKRYCVSSPPNSIDDTRSLQSWQELFRTRWAWTVKVVEDCRQMAREAENRYSEMDVMMRCLDVAVTNLESVIKALEPKYVEFKKWLPTAQAEYGALASGWEKYLAFARAIPVSPAMVRYMTGRSTRDSKGRSQRQTTLEDLVDLDTARKAGRLAPSALLKFNNRVADLDKVASRLFHDAEDLFREFERTVERSVTSRAGEAQQLFHDIEAVAKKINTDYQTVLDHTSSSRDVLHQVSKIAASHTERLLPSLAKRSVELDEMLREATQARNSLAAESIEFMRSITEITALSHSIKSQLNAVNQDDELATFDYLRLLQQVPYMYASFVAEAIRRREWHEKLKQDSSTLANEVALFQEEEIKRRRRWHKSIGDAYGPETAGSDTVVPGLEVKFLGEDEQWPVMTRRDLDEFHALLQSHKADPDIIADVGKIIAELNNPTKQQSKRMKAFKNGSLHEATLGRSGLLIRGDDDLMRSLQDEKLKLESKLKTAESRVRRLEDLLHRQTQASRPTLGNLFHVPSHQLSDRDDSTFSVKSPRAGSEDQRKSFEGPGALSQRIQQLEEELAAEKHRSETLEGDLNAQLALRENLKAQLEEVNSTKRDLLQNLEALKREFTEERKSLEAEIKRLQARLEDTEDQMEHFGESRENEKASYDEHIETLKSELDRLRKEKQEEALKSEGQLDFLRREARLQRETIEEQERQLHAALEESKKLNKKLAALTETADAQLKALHNLWYQFSSPNDAAPDDHCDLIEGLMAKASNTLATVQRLEMDKSLLRSELETVQAALQSTKKDKAEVESRLSNEEDTSTRLRDTVAEQQARLRALEKELADGRDQIKNLRSRLNDGEIDSGTLRKRLEEEEARVASLSEELAARQSQVGALEEEIRNVKERLQESQSKLSGLVVRFDARSQRTKDLTQRLYSYNERLTHLLERLGFSVTRQGHSMSIQKIPRSERSSQNVTDSDPSASLRRSGTLSNSRPLLSSTELDLLNWVNCTDEQSESDKYEAYMSQLGFFDVDAFCEVIYRRVKDVEYMARKLQRDARAYREKAHALQKEAHEKIAYKHFKEGDLALFLPTRNQATGAWAAFNVGFPHYFLREQESHRLRSREWLVARITRIQERVVDLSKSLQQPRGAGTKKGNATSSEPLNDEENDNPFDLSDGLRWYLIDAVEDKPGAPSTPGLGKSTVATNNVEATGDMHTHGRASSKVGGVIGRSSASSGIEGVSKTLSKSLERRRSSTSSKKALPFTIGVGRGRESAVASETNSLRTAPADTPTAASPTQQVMGQGMPPHEPLQQSGAAASTTGGALEAS